MGMLESQNNRGQVVVLNNQSMVRYFITNSRVGVAQGPKNYADT